MVPSVINLLLLVEIPVLNVILKNPWHSKPEIRDQLSHTFPTSDILVRLVVIMQIQ